MKITLEGRCEVKELAGILRALDRKGVRPKTRSEAVETCLYILAGVLEETGMYEEPGSDEEALAYIQRFFGKTLLDRKKDLRKQIIQTFEASCADAGVKPEGALYRKIKKVSGADVEDVREDAERIVREMGIL